MPSGKLQLADHCSSYQVDNSLLILNLTTINLTEFSDFFFKESILLNSYVRLFYLHKRHAPMHIFGGQPTYDNPRKGFQCK